MNFSQILIRMGVDAKAVVTGLNKTSSFIKGWAIGLRRAITSSIGSFFGAAFAIQQLDKLKDKVIEIRNLSQVTGLSTNFIQSLMWESAKAGVSINSMVEPLKNFNNLIGQAKMGVPDAIVKLHDLGIISKQSEINSLNEADALKKLADRYKEFGDSAKRAYYLEKAGFSGNAAISNILSKGSKGIEGMESFNPFKQISKGAISDITDIWTGIKVGGMSTLNFVANYFDTVLFTPVRKFSQFSGALFSGARTWKQIKSQMDQAETARKKSIVDTALAAQAEKENISVQQLKARIFQEQNSLLQQQQELSARINDRNKVSIQDMAAHARKFLGVPDPTKFNFTVSQRDRQALAIDQMEKKASVAFERGDDATFRRLTNEALQARSKLGFAKYEDRQPLQRTVIELQNVNTKLEPVQNMAKLILDEHKQPK